MNPLCESPIDVVGERSSLLNNRAGAYCAYEGWVRESNEGKHVQTLRYEGYPQLAQSVAETIVAEAKAKFTVIEAKVVHRVGTLRIGELAVWVGVTARHRGDAFLACRYIIDNVKYRVPIWKFESYTDGSSGWITSNHCGCADPSNLKVHE